MEIQLIECGHALWQRTIAFARSCSWKAGTALAKKMEENAFQVWERVAVAVEDGELAGFCTFTERDELPEEYGYAPFIGFVFVGEKFRGRRLSEAMIRKILDYAKTLGFRKTYIMSGEQGLYEKYGFVKIGEFQTIYGTTDQLFYMDL